ncbi:short chain dehydrogenase [Colletotrichum chrysophilum]|uniref:Short chain dehydrogenase n=1 Tax=Colletotrichum chrysophilum TaxID=1836956 RepID=A0AAD9ADK9_9PEZI|nr:short chain dehydrogenase [Colletotrichum chrysophilum]
MNVPGLKTYHKVSYAAISPRLPELSQQGNTILITGGSEGIGFAIGKAFIEASAKELIIVSRSEEKINHAASAVNPGSPTMVIGRICDVSSLSSTDSLWTGLQREGKYVDVLVLNAAGVGAIKPLLEMGRDGVLNEFNFNFRSPLDFAERFYKQSIPLKTSKVLVVLSTLAIYLWNAVASRPAYGPSKSAGTLILQQFAREIKPDQMQISIVHPGAIWTDRMARSGANATTYRYDDTRSRFAWTFRPLGR